MMDFGQITCHVVPHEVFTYRKRDNVAMLTRYKWVLLGINILEKGMSLCCTTSMGANFWYKIPDV